MIQLGAGCSGTRPVNEGMIFSIPLGICSDEAPEVTVGDEIFVDIKVFDRDRVTRQFIQKKMRVLDRKNPLEVRNVGGFNSHLERGAVYEDHRLLRRGLRAVCCGRDLCLGAMCQRQTKDRYEMGGCLHRWWARGNRRDNARPARTKERRSGTRKRSGMASGQSGKCGATSSCRRK